MVYHRPVSHDTRTAYHGIIDFSINPSHLSGVIRHANPKLRSSDNARTRSTAYNNLWGHFSSNQLSSHEFSQSWGRRYSTREIVVSAMYISKDFYFTRSESICTFAWFVYPSLNSMVAMVALLRMKYTCVHPAEVNLKPLRESHTSRRTYCSIASWRNGLKLDLKVIVSVRVSYMRKLHYTRWTSPEICANFTELMSYIINPNVLAICTCELIRRNGISFVLGADQIFQLYLMRFVDKFRTAEVSLVPAEEWSNIFMTFLSFVSGQRTIACTDDTIPSSW